MRTLDSRSDVETFLRRWPDVEWTVAEATREDPAGHTAAGWMVHRVDPPNATLIRAGISEAGAMVALWGKFMFVTSAHEAIQSGTRRLIVVPEERSGLDLLMVGDELLFTPHPNFPRAIVTHIVGIRKMILGDLSQEDEEHLGFDFRNRWAKVHERPWDPTVPVWRIEFKRPGSA